MHAIDNDGNYVAWTIHGNNGIEYCILGIGKVSKEEYIEFCKNYKDLSAP